MFLSIEGSVKSSCCKYDSPLEIKFRNFAAPRAIDDAINDAINASETEEWDVHYHRGDKGTTSLRNSSIEKETNDETVKPRKRAKKEASPSKVEPNQETEQKPEEEPRGMKYWLMKAEPDSRIVKGKVSFRIDETENRMSNSVLMTLRK
jgi:hypothetical protein